MAALSLLSVTGVLMPETVLAKPLVPLLSFLQHWDHHWFAWLPGDPVYEAVEVMANRRSGQEPLVWVLFTERAPPKNQVNYYNDIATSSTRNRVNHVVPMRFAMSGHDGAPLGVSVAFDDAESRQVVVEIGVDDDAKLSATGAGLTNQIGHSSAHTLLIFFREASARTQQVQVMIAGVDMTKPKAGVDGPPLPFVAAYSRNIYSGGFPFYGAAVRFGEAGRPPPPAIIFQDSGSGAYEGNGGQRLVTTPEGALKAYQQDARMGHRLDVSFDPPLPPIEHLAAGESASRFTISLDGFASLISGEVTVHRDTEAAMLDWRFDAPDWTRSWKLLSTAALDGDAVTHIELKPIPSR